MPICEIMSYDALNRCHRVKDESGVIRLVDVMINGDFPEETEPESIVGQKVEYRYEHPYIAIAMYVRVID